MPDINRITPCLWFDEQAQQAAEFYVSVFPNSRITAVTHYGEAGQEFHRRPVGSVMTLAFELDGQAFTALNGGPIFQFSPAVSFEVACENQQEVDYYWDKLREGGDEAAQQCGWLKDKFGLSWQVVPKVLTSMILDPDHEKSQRAISAMMQMRKLDIAKLQRAYEH